MTEPMSDTREDVLDLERTPCCDPESTLEADEFYCTRCGVLTREHPVSDYLGRCPACTEDRADA